jgi:uncharacterized protein YjaG (DUF416 family)
MTDWKYNVYLADLFQNFYDLEEPNEFDLNGVIQELCKRLILLRNKIKEKEKDPNEFLKGLGGLNFIIDDLEVFDRDGIDYEEQLERFDEIMNDLYDFADYNFIWINTFDAKSDGIGKP